LSFHGQKWRGKSIIYPKQLFSAENLKSLTQTTEGVRLSYKKAPRIFKIANNTHPKYRVTTGFPVKRQVKHKWYLTGKKWNI